MRLGAVREMTDEELKEEAEQLDRKLSFYESEEFEGHSGSPGEYLYERFDEISQEMSRRFNEKVKGR